MQDLSLLIKPASGLCNCRCTYCFYQDELAYRQQPCRLMSRQVIDAAVSKALSTASRRCSFAFQGGEPTLAGLDFFRYVLEKQKEYNTRGIIIENSIQTNGLLIDGEWAEFLARNRFLTGLSLDGDAAMHNSCRVSEGKGTFSDVMRAARLLRAAGADLNILSVITAASARRGRHLYRFLTSQGFEHLQFIPCLPPFGGSSPSVPSAEQYGDFLIAVYDCWADDLKNGKTVSVRLFDDFISVLSDRMPSTCGGCGICFVQFVLEADGSIYPCDFYATDEWKLGDIFNDDFSVLDSPSARRFQSVSHVLSPECDSCRYKSVCRGGCRRWRADGLNTLCKGYKKFFDYALPGLKALSVQRQAAYE